MNFPDNNTDAVGELSEALEIAENEIETQANTIGQLQTTHKNQADTIYELQVEARRLRAASSFKDTQIRNQADQIINLTAKRQNDLASMDDRASIDETISKLRAEIGDSSERNAQSRELRLRYEQECDGYAASLIKIRRFIEARGLPPADDGDFVVLQMIKKALGYG
jgi:chromosome segregation ATPase